MKVFFSVADGGDFFASQADIDELLASQEGIEWELALNDVGNDPLYCRSRLKITQFDRELRAIDGTIVYNGKPRKFSGKAIDRIWEGKTNYDFKFTEPAAELTAGAMHDLVRGSLQELGIDATLPEDHHNR